MISISDGINIGIPRNKEDLHTCIQMYFNWANSYPIDYDSCFKNIQYNWQRKKFLRVIRRNEKIVAWIFADKHKFFHSDEIFFIQHYYCSNYFGILATKFLIMLHDEMIKEASKSNIKYCMSCCRFDDTRFTLSRILEKIGWQRHGYQAVAYVPDLIESTKLSIKERLKLST